MSVLKNVFSVPSMRSLYRNYAGHIKRDPGIEGRKRILAPADLEEAADLEDLESDFMEVHKTHKEHFREMESRKEREKYLIVKQKYFKEKWPNFLTWHDKEQIRYLYRTDPEEWPVERLSEGFPALPEAIKKIVKSDWTKTKQHKVTNHDTSVQKNWELFKEGKMPELPTDLVEHLNKFTNRALNLRPFVVPNTKESTVEVTNKNVGTEFLDIIRSYERLKQSSPDEHRKADSSQINVSKQIPPGDTYVASPVQRKKNVTLDQLQHNLTNKIKLGGSINEEEKGIVESFKKEKLDLQRNSVDVTLVDLTQKKYQSSTGIAHVNKTPRDLSHLNYPDWITIPKDVHKKGRTYKLNDCYYDDDGEFLYRVPGMG